MAKLITCFPFFFLISVTFCTRNVPSPSVLVVGYARGGRGAVSRSLVSIVRRRSVRTRPLPRTQSTVVSFGRKCVVPYILL